MIVILGASGFLGGYLHDRFRQEQFLAVGTYCRHAKAKLIHFELGQTDFKTLLTHHPTHVFISAAAHSAPEDTAASPDESQEINVSWTLNFIKDCFDHGIVPVFTSTDNVFDGEKGNYIETDRTNPLTLYGRMKCEVEKVLLDSSKPFLLLRFGKVFKAAMGDPTLYTKIVAGARLRLATDQVYTPLFIEDLFAFVRDAVQKKWTGVFHLASVPATTRYEIAQKAVSFFKIDNVEIEPCSIDELNLLEKRPKRIDLNVSKYSKLTGRKLRPIEDFLKMIPR